jgi:hypothetical protein
LEEIEDTVQEHGRDSRFHGLIAAFVAVAATFMALCNVKDGNVVQAMQQVQARAVDQWAYYQAKGSRQHLAEACLSVAVALAGVAALTGRRWLFGLGCAFGAGGFLFGLAGFCKWSLHSDFMARLLG